MRARPKKSIWCAKANNTHAHSVALTPCPSPACGRGAFINRGARGVRSALKRGRVLPLSLRDRRSRSKHSRHCATGAAGRSHPLRPTAQRVIARSAQPVETIPFAPQPNGSLAPPAQPVEAIPFAPQPNGSLAPPAQPVEAIPFAPQPNGSLAPPAQPVEAIPFAPQPNGSLAPPAQPVEAIPFAPQPNGSLRAAAGGEANGHCEPPQAAKQSPSPPAPLPCAGAGRPAPRTGPSPAGRAGVRSSVRSTLKPLVGRGIFSPLLSLWQSPGGIIPMTCDHPAWSPQAARGVVHDPLRFLAALGMTSRCARNDKSLRSE
ncbi:MAG: hypothetical protein KatS3mg058_2347 [Roseiflexus sp.]|nr:MAG: hypothetical protein KatS3mg058_2347 [Roseiflexus sp.]